MGDPRKHHYIPVFYLKLWANADGNVCEMRKFPQRLSILPKAPAATGFKRDLYSIEGVPPEQAQQFESAFLSLADNHAAAGLKALLAGDELDEKQRSGWSRFVTSLLFRTPQAVQEIKDHNLAMWSEAVKFLEDEWVKNRETGSVETFNELFARRHAALPHVENANFMKQIIDEGRVAPDIFKMDWSVIDLKSSKYPLMTSDRPLITPHGLGHRDAHVAIPIGPKKLFVAARRREFKAEVRARRHVDVVKDANKFIVVNAREYVWGVDDSQAPFIKKHISTKPDRVLISEEAKVQALAAARGDLRKEADKHLKGSGTQDHDVRNLSANPV